MGDFERSSCRDGWKFAYKASKPGKAFASRSNESHVSCTPVALLTTYPTTSKTIFIVQQQNSWQNVTSTPNKSFHWHSCTAFCSNSQDILGHGRSKVSKTVLNSAFLLESLVLEIYGLLLLSTFNIVLNNQCFVFCRFLKNEATFSLFAGYVKLFGTVSS